MTFAQLVQSKLPTRYLGAEIRRWWWLANVDAAAVLVVGMDEPLILSGKDLCNIAAPRAKKEAA